MQEHRTKLQGGGRVVIPASYRRAMDLAPGEEIILRLEDGELHLFPVREALNRARSLVKKYRIPASLVDDLIRERREEAKHE